MCILYIHTKHLKIIEFISSVALKQENNHDVIKLLDCANSISVI